MWAMNLLLSLVVRSIGLLFSDNYCCHHQRHQMTINKHSCKLEILHAISIIFPLFLIFSLSSSVFDVIIHNWPEIENDAKDDLWILIILISSRVDCWWRIVSFISANKPTFSEKNNKMDVKNTFFHLVESKNTKWRHLASCNPLSGCPRCFSLFLSMLFEFFFTLFISFWTLSTNLYTTNYS